MKSVMLLWLALAVALGYRFRPRPGRRPWLSPPASHRSRPRPLVNVGRALRGRANRPSDRRADARLGAAVGWFLVGLLLSPAYGLGLGLSRWVLGGFTARRQRTRSEQQIVRDLPDVVDLLVLGISAGLSVPKAIAAAAEVAAGPVADGLHHALARTDLGERLGDALETIPAARGEPLRQLVRPLVASERYGVALLPALEVLAIDVRAQRRRQAEIVARRLPVKLLFPLVLCILPAFALLTVVPVVASSLQAVEI